MTPGDRPTGGPVVALLGVPFDDNSSDRRGTAGAPAAIRGVLRSPAGNLCTEDGLDLSTEDRFRDRGDLTPDGENAPDYFARLRTHVEGLLATSARLLTLGGDHSITYPLLQALAAARTGFDVLQIDAHPDLYDELGGNRLSHASPFARVMEEGLARRLVQVGIRTLNPHQREQARRFGVEAIEMRDWRPELLPAFERPVYVSIDMDAFDPAFAPGVSHPEPGGFATRDVLDLLRRLEAPVIGADVVELNPQLDPTGITAALGAKLVKELAAVMLRK